MATLKYDKVVLVKEFGKMHSVGETYEIASVLDNSFVIRDYHTKVALGVISFEEFNNYFSKEPDVKGWTSWTKFTDKDGGTAFYRTNFKKVEVRCNNVRALASCNLNEDYFNLSTGLMIAYGRCLNKLLLKEQEKYEKKLKEISEEISENKNLLKNIMDSLRGKEDK